MSVYVHEKYIHSNHSRIVTVYVAGYQVSQESYTNPPDWHRCVLSITDTGYVHYVVIETNFIPGTIKPPYFVMPCPSVGIYN